MAMPPMELRDFQLAIHFETNRSVDLRRLAAFLTALGEFADERLGPEAEFELTHLSRGSVTAVFDAWGSVIGGIGGFGSFVLAVVMYIESNRQRRLSKRAAELVVDDGVVSISVEAKAPGRIVIQGSSVAAVEVIVAQRESQAKLSGWGNAYGQDYGGSGRFRPRGIEDARPAWPNLVTQDGRPIVTEDGTPIMAQAHEPGELPMHPDYEEFLDAIERNPGAYNDDPRGFGVYVGRIKLVDSKRYFITESGRNFRLVGVQNVDYPPNQTYVVRGPALKDAAGSHDWLEAKDLFVPSE